ncbi:hypothetical protein [Phaeobacter sp. B1627]|uniref:hypothetical protein n=1 Tax=Phaeobacter sp. B1627 TaxID=2583809 RepID=UPI001117EB41|nr:hypothetical protein [Phaeobacter sp. B1627]TNJ48543.1 hypothetical protein FGE21_00925 [Phaeobacter sp. B1627]
MGDGRISVLGDPATAGFCAGLWAVAGHHVSWHAPAPLRHQFLHHGLELIDANGLDARVGPDVLCCPAEPTTLGQADMVILCDCPPADCPDMAALLSRHCRPQVPVLSLRSRPCVDDPLAGGLGGWSLRPGLIPWEVHADAGYVRADRALRFRRHGSGPVVVAAGGHSALSQGLDVPCLEVTEQADVSGRIWGRILTDLAQLPPPETSPAPTGGQRDPQWRGLVADQLQEALMVLHQAGIRPVPPSGLPLWMRLRILRMRFVPDDLVWRLGVWTDRTAGPAIAQTAMASGWDELLRPLLDLGRRLGVSMPIHKAMAAQAASLPAVQLEGDNPAALPGDRP